MLARHRAKTVPSFNRNLSTLTPSLSRMERQSGMHLHYGCIVPALFALLPVAVSAISRQPVERAWFPPPSRPDIQDRRLRTETARIQLPGQSWPFLSLIVNERLKLTRFWHLKVTRL